MIRIRSAEADDIGLLWDCLAIAAYEPSVASAMSVPLVAAHLDGWKRPGDFGVIAEIEGRTVGAAWARQFRPEEQPSYYVDALTPEISIGVRETARGLGAGKALIDALITEARSAGLGLCLNVRDSNPAVRLYEGAGFRRAPGSEVRNRAGGISFGMVLPRRSIG